MSRSGILAAGLLLVAGCSLLSPAYAPLPELIGPWEWQESIGGFAGIRQTPASAGYTMRLTFHADGTFVLARSDQPPRLGRYDLYRRNGTWYVRYHLADSRWMPQQRIDFAAPDTLWLHDRCEDCFSHRFRRLPQ